MTPCTATVHDTMAARRLHGCRCLAALRATSHYDKRLRIDHARGHYRLVDVTGSRRRLQALCAIGYSQPELARRLSLTQARIWQYLEGPRPTVRRSTAERIARLYEELADTPSTGPRAGRARATAARHGWLAPLWWDDDTIDDPTHQPAVEDSRRHRDEVDPVIVDRLVEGSFTGRPTPAERFEAFLRLRAGGWSDQAIVDQLRLSGSTFAEYERRADADGIEEAA